MKRTGKATSLAEGTSVIDSGRIGEAWNLALLPASGTAVTFGDLIEAWAGEVLAISSQLDQHGADYFTADDYEGALFARDRVERGLLTVLANNVRGGPPPPTPAIVAAVDELFRSITMEEASRPPATWAYDERPTPDRWWWYRIPVRGPIRREIDLRAEEHRDANSSE